MMTMGPRRPSWMLRLSSGRLSRPRWWSAQAQVLEDEYFRGKTNEFEVMGVAADVTVDLRKLEANMRELQRRYHPDKYATRPREEREVAEVASSRVNTSYAVVKDPLLRANRAIALRLGQKDVLAEDGGQTNLVDVELLMEILEVREAIDETTDLDALRDIKHRNNANMRDAHAAVVDHFRHHRYERAAADLVRLQYYSKIRTEIFAVSQRRGWDLHVCQVPII
mmetsp:Transcript_13448/g.43809  ORF Transcript_13448/g.43809 Transcript_13448/m.43809 type:complete len:224 (-) Transcript_13448:115-786(-)